MKTPDVLSRTGSSQVNPAAYFSRDCPAIRFRDIVTKVSDVSPPRIPTSASSIRCVLFRSWMHSMAHPQSDGGSKVVPDALDESSFSAVLTLLFSRDSSITIDPQPEGRQRQLL